MAQGRARAAIQAGRPPLRSPGRPPVNRRAEKQEFWRKIAEGLSSEFAAVACGVSQPLGPRWFREGGGMPPICLDLPSGRYLSFAEREEIALLRAKKCGVREIARRTGRLSLTIEHPPSQLPGQFQIEEDHYEELRRCLNDPTLPSDVRIAAALIRLYALPLTRIVELTTDHLHHDVDHTYLTIIRHPVVLPPKLARLIDDHLEDASRHGNEATRYLLPGRAPGRPRNPAGLSDKLKRYGLPARAARNTAMMQALADMPPVVLSDLIGIQPRTAERFAAMAGENWSDYLAATRPHQTIGPDVGERS